MGQPRDKKEAHRQQQEGQSWGMQEGRVGYALNGSSYALKTKNWELERAKRYTQELKKMVDQSTEM